jgi:hypothetical protein
LVSPCIYYLNKKGYGGRQATTLAALLIVLIFGRAIKALWAAMLSK